MAHERVYHPETCEPFDVTPSKARDLVLEHGWTRTPWTRVEPATVADEPARGRGRRRRVIEETPAEFVQDDQFLTEPQDDAESWRS